MIHTHLLIKLYYDCIFYNEKISYSNYNSDCVHGSSISISVNNWFVWLCYLVLLIFNLVFRFCLMVHAWCLNRLCNSSFVCYLDFIVNIYDWLFYGCLCLLIWFTVFQV